MTTGLSTANAAAINNALLNNTAYTGPAQHFIKLHLGDPGAAGTANAAANTSRQEAIYGTSSGGPTTNTNVITWANVPATEHYTHFSDWSTVGPSGGTFQFSGTINSTTTNITEDFVVAAGGLDTNLTNVAG